jgi:hypothetical protein
MFCVYDTTALSEPLASSPDPRVELMTGHVQKARLGSAIGARTTAA